MSHSVKHRVPTMWLVHCCRHKKVMTETELYNALSTDQKSTLDLYKSNNDLDGQPFCYEINKKLNEGEELSGTWLEKSILLDDAISSLECKQEFTLYRACFWHDIEKNIKNNKIINPAYMSCATDIEAISRHYATCFDLVEPVLMEILVTKNQTYFPLEGKSSFGGHEMEVLLPRNTIMEVTETSSLCNKDLDYIIALGQYSSKFPSLRKLNVTYKNA